MQCILCTIVYAVYYDTITIAYTTNTPSMPRYSSREASVLRDKRTPAKRGQRLRVHAELYERGREVGGDV